MNTIDIVILAAGHGTRMQREDIPKPLVPLHGMPMIGHLVAAIKASGVCEKPTVVIGQKAEMVKEYLGDDYIYVTQEQQLGTGHAVAVTREALEGHAKHVMVLYADHPLLTSATIANLAKTHLESDSAVTLGVCDPGDFDDWKEAFFGYGRIIRNDQGEIQEIIERKDATEEQQKITEVNPGYYCFNAEWLWKHIDLVQNKNAQGEYYLTDLIALARKDGVALQSVSIEAFEALGANTAEQLEVLHRFSQT